jgi:NAD(P)-dependent dehydrogenase (short-subunit alcohol dehydrogenase family)
LFAPLLIRSPHARLIFLSSSNASLGAAHESLTPIWGRGRGQEIEAGWPKEGLTTWQGYKCAKAAVNMCMLTWYQLLKADGVKTFAVSPGLLATHLGGNTPRKWKRVGAKDASLGGELVRMVVEGERDEDIGRVITQDGVQEW